MTESQNNSVKPCRFVAVGAGRMGRGIAIAFAYAGYRVALLDLRKRNADEWDALAADVSTEVASTLQTLTDIGVMRADQIDAIAERVELYPETAVADVLGNAEIVFECVPETMDAKRDAFRVLNSFCGERTVVTSTTSSILVTNLVELVSRPEQFFNMHWLNPAYLIPIVEISSHAGTRPEALEQAKVAVESIGKLAVMCGPAPGYIVPRLQALIMNEAARMVEEGVATAEEIDKATRFGLGLRFSSVGVLEFIDFGGCEILQHASHQMGKSIDPNRYAAPDIIETMIRDERLGLRTGSGFFDYPDRHQASYRKSVLQRTADTLRSAGKLKAPAEEPRE